MASFYAELQVAGAAYSVRYCTYEFAQATSERGRVAAKVRAGLVHLTLEVPEDDKLLDWAATPYKPLAGHVVFYDAQGGRALETLAWEAGQCVSYQEEFASGDLRAGAYVCHLAITAPQLTMQPGGPGTYAAPAPGEHGIPALEAATIERTIIALPAGHLRKSDADKSDPDPVRRLLGPGRLSHPEEWSTTVAMLQQAGVEVSYRSGAMGYWAVPNAPGRMLLDPEMSISALRHETRHFLDDRALDYPGMGYFFNDLDERWRFEFNAYREEINFVRDLREFSTGHELVELARQEKTLIYLKD